MIYEEYIKSNKIEFINKVNAICAKLRIQPEWLMIVMYAESRLNPAALNRNGGASGLIQFMPSTALSLGTTTTALRAMSNVQQLDWVYKYFAPYAGRILNVYDLYLVTFFPVALGKPDNYVMQTTRLSAKVIAKANPGIDLNKDLQITVGEFKMYVDKYLKKKVK